MYSYYYHLPYLYIFTCLDGSLSSGFYSVFVAKLYNGVKQMGVLENVKHVEAGIPINSWS